MKTSTNSLNSKSFTVSGTRALALLAVAILTASAAKAQNVEWQGGTASYNTPADWVGGTVPGPTNNAINSNGTNNIVLINIGDPDWTVTDLSAAGDPLSTGAIQQNGQNVNLSGWLHIAPGSNSFGIYTLNGGTLNVTNAGCQLFLCENPGATGVLNINNGIINLAGNTFHIADGNWNGPGARTGIVNQVNGTINTSGQTLLGAYTGGSGAIGVGVYTLQGGTINCSNYFGVGLGGGNGTLNMTGGLINHSPSSDEAFVIADASGSGGTVGTFNFSGGTVNSFGAEYWIGNGGSALTGGPSLGTNNISGTASLNVNTWIAIGRGGTGVLNLSGGAITKTGPNNITIGADVSGNGVGTVNQTGGVITNTTSQTWIGEAGTGTWNMNGGAAYLGLVNIGEDGGANGTLNLNGGIFQVSSIGTGSSSTLSELNFNGGTLQANANSATFISGLTEDALVGSGGATIDSQGYNITIPQEIDDNGGGQFTKIGSGILTLTGPNTYAGNTVVNAGTLMVGTGSSASGNYSVADNAAFGVYVLSAGGQLAAQQNVTLGSSSGASLDFNLGGFGNPGSAPLNISGTLTANGTITINIADALPQLGQFPLVQFPNGGLAGAGTFVLGSLPTGVTAHLVITSTTISLDITGVNLPRWEGLAGGTWDIGLTTNWINLGTALPTYYDDGNAVVFNDSAMGTTNVNITTTVNPGSVTITNNVLNYTFNGSGSINGATGLNKQGSGTLSILNAGGNGYTGPTVISGGTLIVSNLANGGSPSAIGASSASPTNLVLAGGALSYIGLPVAISRGYSMTASSTINVQSNSTLTLSGLSQVSGATTTLTRSGAGTQTYAGIGTNVLSTGDANPGYQIQAGTVIFDGSAGTQTNSENGQMYVGGTTNSGATLILTNTSLGTSDWFAAGRGTGNNDYTSMVSLYNSVLSCPQLSLGYANGLSNVASQVVNLTNSQLLITGSGLANVAESAGSTATVNLNGNSLFSVAGGTLNVGSANAGPFGVINVNGNSVINANVGVLLGGGGGEGVLNLTSTNTSSISTSVGPFRVGGNAGSSDVGVGAINQSAGTFTSGVSSGDYLALGIGSATAYGSYNLSGGTLNRPGTGIRLGRSGLASFVQSGGIFNCGGEFSLSSTLGSGNGVAAATFIGGSTTVNSGYGFRVPESSSFVATVNIGTEAGGSASVVTLFGSGFQLCYGSGTGSGTLNLDSGTLQLGGPISKVAGAGTGVANFDGGTVQAGVNNITLIDTTPSSANVFKGGLTVDTMTNTATVSGNLVTTFGNGIYPAAGMFIISSNGGSGYIGAPLVTVSGGSGSGATAVATVSGGAVTNVIMTCPGQNYQAGDVLTFTFAGGGLATIAGNLVVASNFVYTLQAGDVAANSGGGLIKIGSGRLYLTGGSTYTGATLVNSGVLSGSGTIYSPVTVASGATLGVGSSQTSIGTFTVNNTVTLSAGSTNFMKVNKTGGTKDLITGMSQINYGGTLVISNQAGTLAANDSFKLYNATTYTGAFATIVPATPGAGLIWNTNQLAVSGTLSVASGVNTNPTNITFHVSGGNLNLSWPSDHLGWRLLVQTNTLATGLSTNWATWPNSTNVTSEAIPITATNPCVFFRLVYP